jgi:acyl-CoA hydrolase
MPGGQVNFNADAFCFQENFIQTVFATHNKEEGTIS